MFDNVSSKPPFKWYVQVGRKLSIEDLIKQLEDVHLNKPKLTGKYEITDKYIAFELKEKK